MSHLRGPFVENTTNNENEILSYKAPRLTGFGCFNSSLKLLL